MMKKLFGIPMVVLLVALGVSTALAYVVAGMDWAFTVEEPIVVTVRPETPVRTTVMPGEEFTVTLEVRNRSENAAYGMKYWGTIYWANYGFEMNAQSVKDATLVLDKPQQSGKSLKVAPAPTRAKSISTPPSPPTNYYWGTVRMTLDPDGPGGEKPQPYLPGKTAAIGPKGTHYLYLTVRPAADIPPGEWQVELLADRGEPNLEAN